MRYRPKSTVVFRKVKIEENIDGDSDEIAFI